MWYREWRFKKLLRAMSPRALRVAQDAYDVGGRALRAHIVEKRHGERRDKCDTWDPTFALRASHISALREAVIGDLLCSIESDAGE